MGKYQDAIAALPKERLLSYLPKELVAELKPGEAVAPIYKSYSAAMLYVDVTGFSNIANKLNSVVADGAETLTTHLNMYFTKIIDIIRRHGGDILLFSGDALLVSWASGDDDIIEKCVSCILCGMHLSKQCAEHRFAVSVPGGEDLLLEMNLHIGASYGPAIGAIVGGACPTPLGTWKYIVLGAVVESAGVAANAGSRGSFVLSKTLINSQAQLAVKGAVFKADVGGFEEEFVIFEGVSRNKFADEPAGISSPDAAAVCSPLQTVATFESLQDADGSVPMDPVSPGNAGSHGSPEAAALRSEGGASDCSDAMRGNMQGFVFDTVVYSELNMYQRETKGAVSASQSGGAQLRTVSTLFVKLNGICVHSSDHAMLHAKTQRAVRIIQKALVRVDGVLNKVIMDDKGVICVCVFGIPHHSHEDDPLRSVMFAHKISAKLTKDIGNTIIGICRSYVFCGTTGSSHRKEYTVLGDGVNIAARLMARCESENAKDTTKLKKDKIIMCDWDTANEASRFEKTAQNVAFVEAGEIQLKGREGMFASYYVVPASEKDRVTRDLSSASGGAPHPSPGGLSRHVSMGSHSSKSLSSRSSVSSFGSLFSLPKVFQANSMGPRSRGPRNSAAPLQKTHSIISPIQHISSVRSGSSLRSAMSDGNLSVHSAQSMSKLRNTLDGIISRKEELEILGQFCEAFCRPQRGGRSSLSPSNLVRARAQRTDEPPLVLGILGLMQTGKTKFLYHTQDLLDRRQSHGLLIVASETSMDTQYDGLRPAVQRMLAEGDIALSGDVDEEDLNLVSYICRDERIGLPTEEQAEMTRREKMNRINEVLMSMISAAYGWPIMLMIDDIKSLDYASLYFVVWALDRGCATIYTERISITDKGTNHHSPGDDTTKVAAFGNVAGASMSVTRRSENPRDDIASHSTSSDGGPLSMLDLSGTARNEDISALRHKLYEAEGQRIIRLEPMTRPQHDRLLNYLFLYDVDPDLSGKLYVKTGGIPGFTAQICANLIEGNHVSVRNAQVVLAKKGRLEEKAVHFVKGLEAHVLTLVESLPEEARVGLHVCAVLQIDGTFEYAVFKAMMERLSEDPDSALRVLMQANLIVQTLVNRDRPPHSDDVQPVSPPLPKSTANDADRRSKGSRASTPMMPGDRQSPTAMLPVQMYCPSTSMDALNEDGLRSGGERHLIFTQQLARDAIYLTLLQSVRKQYHSSAADIIVEQERDQQCGQRKALTSQRLFYHLSRSGKNTPFRYCYSAFIAAIGSNKIDIAMNYLDSVSDGGTTLTAYEEVMYFFNKLACVNEMGREEDFLEPSNTDSVIEGVQQFQAKERSTRKVPGGDARRAPQRKGAGKRGFFACCCGGGEAEDPHEAYLDGMENSSLGRGNSELSMRNVGGDDEVISQRYGADLHQDMYASLSAYSGKPLTSSSPRTGDPAKKLGPHATDAVAKQEVVVLFYTLLAELRFAKGDKAQVSAAVARVADAQRALARMDYSAGSSVLGLNPQESALEMDVKFLIDEKSRTAQARQARSTSSNRLTTTCMFGAMSAFKFPDILRLLSQHGYTSQHNMHKTLVQLPGLHKRPQEPIMLVVHGKFRLSLHGLMRSMQVVGYILQGDSANAKGCIDELRECGSPKWSLSALHLKSIARGFMLVDGLGGYATNKLTLLSKMQKAGLSALATETQASMLSGCGFADIVMEVLHTACTKSEVSLATALEDLEKQAGIATPHLGLAVLSVVDRIAAQVSNPSGVTPPAVNLPSPPERKLSGPPNADMLQRAVKLLKRVAEWFPVFEPCALLYEGIAPAGKQPVLQRFEDCIVAASRYGMKGSIFVWRARTHLLLARTLQEEHLSSITDLLASYTKNGFHSPAEYSALEAAELGLKNS